MDAVMRAFRARHRSNDRLAATAARIQRKSRPSVRATPTQLEDERLLVLALGAEHWGADVSGVHAGGLHANTEDLGVRWYY